MNHVIEGPRPAVAAKPHTPTMLRLIAGLALAKALIFTLAGLGVLHLMHHDVEETLNAWLSAVHLDPDGERLHKLVANIAGVSVQRLRLIGFGAFFYAILYLVEGIGLWLDQTWAEWLTIVGSSLLLPLELYEMVERLTVLKTCVFAINVAVVVYLVMRVRRKLKTHQAHPA